MFKKAISILLSATLMGTFLTNAVPAMSATELPKMSGRLVYHSYDSYGDDSSELFIFNFKTNKLECISNEWTNVKDPMNAVWTDNGKAVVFMGMNTVDPISEFYSWDIFYYEIGSEGNPINLTNDPMSRCEDPKMFKSFNNKIIYKAMENDCNYIRMITINGGEVEINTIYSSTEIEPAMPFYMISNYYFSGLDKNGEMDIYRLNAIDGEYIAEKVPYCSEPDTFEYYPVLYSNPNWFLYTSHTNADKVDYIYRGGCFNQQSELMPFNIEGCDTADPCVVNEDYTITSSIRPGGNGGYDLYLCDNLTGEAIALSDYNENINTGKNELAAWYTPTNDAKCDLENISDFVLAKPYDSTKVFDINNDNAVNVFDVVIARRRASGARYTLNGLWRLLDEKYKLSREEMHFVDITTDDVFEETGCQIFKEYGNFTSFLIFDDDVYSIGDNFGGLGLTDMYTCDFDGNGVKDIIYSCSMGSGIHSSFVAIFDLTTMEQYVVTSNELNEYGLDSPFRYWEDLYFEKISDTEFEMYANGITDYTLGGPKNGKYIGKVICQDGCSYIVSENDL